MTYNSIKNVSYSISIVFHLVLLLLFLIINVSFDYPIKDYVELSFGNSGGTGSSGGKGTQIEKVEELSKPEEKDETPNDAHVVKEVELPKAVNTSPQNVITPAEKDKKKAASSKSENTSPINSNVTTSGQGNKGLADGGFGYDIDWGGNGQRKIYYYTIPDYPAGVQKEIDIRLKFTILPDGTVGTIIPLTKADTRLENAAINSLRQWRFEALSRLQKQGEQVAVIVFPYRLR